MYIIVINHIFSIHSFRNIKVEWTNVDNACGILPVNGHAEVNILTLLYILAALYFILLPPYCQMIYTIINNYGTFC